MEFREHNQDQIQTLKLNFTPVEISELTEMPLIEVRHEIKRGRLVAAVASSEENRVERSELIRWWRVELERGELFDTDETE